MLKWSRVSVSVAAVAALLSASSACGTDKLGAGAGSSWTPPPSSGDACATPNEGCPCDLPGTSVECGKVEQRSGDYVTCSMGFRTCVLGKWGACTGTTLTTKSVASGVRIQALAVDAGTCTDPCNPYCQQYADTPAGIPADGGVAEIDGGLTIDPNAVGGTGSAVSPGFVSNPAGVTSCAPDRNIVGTGAARACTFPGIGQCQQDFHCDAFTSTCLWSASSGYKDPACGGVDLTIGAPCGMSSSPRPVLPLCNRGSTAVPTGATITLHEATGTTAPNACTNLGTPKCTYSLPFDLTPGTCVSLTYCVDSPGEKFVTVNAGLPGQPPASGGPQVAECSNAPGGQRCQNNSAYMKTDGSSCGMCQACNTTISGKVFDPSGTTAQAPGALGANNLPLPGITVFQPAAVPPTLTDGVACDTCNALQGPYQTGAITDAAGAFVMNNVSPGASGTVPIIVQSGRWRRKIHITSADLVSGGAIVACQNNPIKDGRLRLPRSDDAAVDNALGQAGWTADVPKTALVIGDREALECWVRRIGIADSEIRPRLASGNTARFQVFRTNGSGIVDVNGPNCTSSNVATTCTLNTTTSQRTCSGGKCVYYPDYTSTNQISSRALYTSPTTLNEFTALLLPCDSDVIQGSTYTTWKANVRDYLARGGRAFMNHLTGEEFLRDGPAPLNGSAITTWQNWADPSNGGLAYAKGWIPPSSPAHTTFRTWMNNAGASPFGVGSLRSDDPKKHALVPGSASTEWVEGRTDNNWNSGYTNGDYSLSLSFETGYTGSAPPPTGTTVVGRSSAAVSCGVPSGTGRVVFNGMHVSQARMPSWPTTSSNRFPTNCSTGALTSEEKALEYQFFQLTACAIGGAPPTPVVNPPLPIVDYYRDYQASCSIGFKLYWRFFYWQSVIPTTTTKIQFRAATAATQAALPASPPGAAPTSVSIGTATTTVPAGPLPAPQWASGPTTVHDALKAQANVDSASWLRVYMRFTPDNTTSPYQAPSLNAWRATYDCVPEE